MDPGTVQEYFIRLAKNGWAEEAKRIIAALLSSQRLSAPEADSLLAAVTANTGGPGHGEHQLYGIVADSVVSSLQFSRLHDYEEMKSSFRQAVRWIEIETSSQCNRQCSYCPNSVVDRRSGNRFMEWLVFAKMIAELKEIGYDGAVKFVGNNEFFMHEKNFDYLRHARELLPGAQFELFSNGDYLTRELLNRAAHLKVGRLTVTLHNAPTKRFTESDTLSRVFRLSQKLGISFVLLDHAADTRLVFFANYGGMAVVVHNLNFEAVGHDWGAFFEERRREPRTAPCTYPLRQLIVNHLGEVFICCRAFKGATPYTIESGSLTTRLSDHPTIFHLYASDRHIMLRQSLFSNETKKGPCEHCAGDEEAAIVNAQQILAAIAPPQSTAVSEPARRT